MHDEWCFILGLKGGNPTIGIATIPPPPPPPRSSLSSLLSLLAPLSPRSSRSSLLSLLAPRSSLSSLRSLLLSPLSPCSSLSSLLSVLTPRAHARAHVHKQARTHRTCTCQSKERAKAAVQAQMWGDRTGWGHSTEMQGEALTHEARWQGRTTRV